MRLALKGNQAVIPHTLWDVKSTAKDAEQYRAQTLSQQPEYILAKKQGDYEAAFSIADRLMSIEALILLERRLDLGNNLNESPKNKPVVIAPVKVGSTKNVLPIAYAHRLAYEFGLEVNRDIVQVDQSSRTGKGAFYRMTHQSEFVGDVQKGRKYVIVDDVLTMGGSIAGLASYIQGNGGQIVCSSVLANQSTQKGKLKTKFQPQELVLNIRPETVKAIGKHYGYGFDEQFQKAVGFPIQALTEREGNFISHFAGCKRDFFTAIETEKGDAAGERFSPRHDGHKRPARPGRKSPEAQPTF